MTKYQKVVRGKVIHELSDNPCGSENGDHGQECTVIELKRAPLDAAVVAIVVNVPLGSNTEQFALTATKRVSANPDAFDCIISMKLTPSLQHIIVVFTTNPRQVNDLFGRNTQEAVNMIPVNSPLLDDKGFFGHLQLGSVVQVAFPDLATGIFVDTFAIVEDVCSKDKHFIKVLILPFIHSQPTLLDVGTAEDYLANENVIIRGSLERRFSVCRDGFAAIQVVGGLLTMHVNVKSIVIPQQPPHDSVYRLLLVRLPPHISKEIKRTHQSDEHAVSLGEHCLVRAGPYSGVTGTVMRIKGDGSLVIRTEQGGLPTRARVPCGYVVVGQFSPGSPVAWSDGNGNTHKGWIETFKWGKARVHDSVTGTVHSLRKCLGEIRICALLGDVTSPTTSVPLSDLPPGEPNNKHAHEASPHAHRQENAQASHACSEASESQTTQDDKNNLTVLSIGCHTNTNQQEISPEYVSPWRRNAGNKYVKEVSERHTRDIFAPATGAHLKEFNYPTPPYRSLTEIRLAEDDMLKTIFVL
ncbi:hypothetical protein NMY22_g9643 [Coprinellus aureogranulatus]|nr:hypothetical protein NMY22_g9643 [Coprinellus aureogranulatus]